MRYHRLGHVNKIYVKAGNKVKRGQLIATNGTGNGQWLAHCHYDIFKQKQTSWERYNIGWTKAETLKVWTDPTEYFRIVMPEFHHFGWRWLQKAKYGSGYAWHPGLDLNGAGAGNADFDDPLYSPVDGTIEYIYNGSGKNHGWGRIIIIEETMAKTYHIVSDLRKQLDRFGKKRDYDDKDQQRAKSTELKKELDDNKELAEKTKVLIKKAEDTIELQRETIDELEKETKDVKDGKSYKWNGEEFEEIVCEGGVLDKAWKWMVNILWSSKPK